MNQVYVCGSYYHIYISILRSLFFKNSDSKSLIIIHDHIPHLPEIIPLLIENNFFDFHLAVPFTSVNRAKTSKILRALKRKSLLVDRIDSGTEILRFETFIRNAEINIFNNRGGAYNYFVQKFKGSYIRLIEDGLGNYQSLIGKFKAFRRKYIFNLVIGAGHDDEIQEILVQFPEKVVEPALKPKAKKLELQKMQDSLSEADRERMLNVFLRDFKMSVSGEKKLILITQPFPYLDLATKIKLYNEVLDLYGSEYTIFIKPHPRDQTDYRGINYSFTEIPRHFPLEMMNLLKDIQFDLGVTLYSGALHNISGVKEKIFLGKAFMEKYR